MVTTAPERRSAHAEAALHAGYHVLVASPLAPTADTARRLVALAAEHDRRLMAGHRLRYHPAVAAVEALAARGELGAVRTVRSERTGDAVEALVAEDLAVALAFAGPPESVAAWARGDDDWLLAVACAGDVRLHLAASRTEIRPAQRLHVGGTLGTAVVDRLRPDAPLRLYRVADAPATADRHPVDLSVPYIVPSDPGPLWPGRFWRRSRSGAPRTPTATPTSPWCVSWRPCAVRSPAGVRPSPWIALGATPAP